MIESILAKIPLVVTILTVGGTGLYSLGKVLDTKPDSGNGVIPISVVSEKDQGESTLGVNSENLQDLGSGSMVDQSDQVSVVQSSTNSGSSGVIVTGNADFTLQDLATHNTSTSCYVGFNGKVYDVTNVISWSGCVHHGIRGGQDITSRFPHPLSYLTGIPIVGNLVDSNGNSTASTTGTKGDGDSDDDEHESEEEKTQEREHSFEIDD